MKSLIIVLSTCISSILVVYLCGAFVHWNFNPEYWDSDSRGLTVMFFITLWFILMIIIFAEEINKKDRKEIEEILNKKL